MKRSVRRLRLVLFAAVGLALFILINWRAAPDAEQSLQNGPGPRIAKTEAAETAKRFVGALSKATANVGLVTVQSDQTLSGYLQKTGLYGDYAKTYMSRVPLDYFRVELHTADEETYLVDIGMDGGEPFGWRKRTDLEPPEPEAGRRIAEAYMARHNIPIGEYEWTGGPDAEHGMFIYTHRTAKIGDARLELRLEVRGDEVVAFRYAFRVPDAYLAWLAAQDAASSAMTRWSLILSALLGVAATAAAVSHRRRAAFSRGLLPTVVFAAVYTVNNFNLFPAYKAVGSESADPFQSGDYAAAAIVIMQLLTVGMSAATYVSLVAGDAMWRRFGRPAWPRWREAGFGQATLVGMGRGYLLACGLIGVQSVLFWIAWRQFGAWAVNDPSQSLYNMFKPALFPLMAWAAAISEEAVYRLFGIALFKKLFRSTFLAVLVPSVIWALSHTQYAIYPVYTRFAEVTVLGLIFGYAFLRYGFLAVLFAHASFDSLLMSLSLIDAEGSGSVVYGLGYVALPAVIAVAIRAMHGAITKKKGQKTKTPADRPDA